MQSWPAGTSLPATGAEAAGSGADACAGSHALLADENNGVCTALHKLPRININFYATKAAAAAGSRCSNNSSSRNNNGNKRRLSPASAAKYAAVFHIATTTVNVMHIIP